MEHYLLRGWYGADGAKAVRLGAALQLAAAVS